MAPPRTLAVFVFLALVALPAARATDAQGTLGVATSVAANDETTISFGLAGDNAQLIVEVDADSDVTLSLYVNAGIELTDGFTALSFGAGVGYELEVDGGNLVSARLVTAQLNAASRALITGSVDAGILRVDSATEFFSRVSIAGYDTGVITVDLPRVGVYVLVAAEASAGFPTVFGERRECNKDEERRIIFPVTARGQLEVTVTTSSDNGITVTESTTASEGDEPSSAHIDAFLTIDLDTEEDVEATLWYQYTADAAADASINAEAQADLAFFFWDDGKWVEASGTANVDVEARVVTQTTTHFSEWNIAVSSGAALAPGLLLILGTLMLLI